MKIKLPPLQSRILALFLLLATTALIASVVAVPAVMLHRHYDSAIDEGVDNLIRYRRFAEQSPGIKQEIERITALNSKRFFLKTNNPSLAASEVQDIIKQVVETSRGKLISVQILPPKDEGKYRKIALTVQTSVTHIALQQILHGLEMREPMLFIDNLSVRAAQGRQYRPLPGVDPEFGLQITLHGYAIINPS